jgi:hypothetical protein
LLDAEARAGRNVTRWSNEIHVFPQTGINIITKDPSLLCYPSAAAPLLSPCTSAPQQFFSTRRVFGRFAIAVRSPPGE